MAQASTPQRDLDSNRAVSARSLGRPDSTARIHATTPERCRPARLHDHNRPARRPQGDRDPRMAVRLRLPRPLGFKRPHDQHLLRLTHYGDIRVHLGKITAWERRARAVGAQLTQLKAIAADAQERLTNADPSTQRRVYELLQLDIRVAADRPSTFTATSPPTALSTSAAKFEQRPLSTPDLPGLGIHPISSPNLVSSLRNR